MTKYLPARRGLGWLDPVFDPFDRDFDEFFNRMWPARGAMIKAGFKLDVREKDNEYLVEADLPGIKKEEIHIDLDEGRLTISVEREEKTEEEKKDYVHRERRYSSMSRSIYLAGAKQEGITAKMENGVLDITIPKEAAPASKVDIQIE